MSCPICGANCCCRPVTQREAVLQTLRRRVSEFLQVGYKIPQHQADADVGQMSDDQVYAEFSRLKVLEGM